MKPKGRSRLRISRRKTNSSLELSFVCKGKSAFDKGILTMSVMDVKEHIERVANTVIQSMLSRNINYYWRAVLTSADENYYIRLDAAKDDVFENHILCWANRVYWANQLAAFLTYKDIPRTLTDIDEKKVCGIPLSARELFEAVCHIEYNIHSNGGRTMLSAEDMERLQTRKGFAAVEVITR